MASILCSAAPAAADPDKANSLDAAGKAAFEKGACSDAVSAFRAAYGEDPRSVLLFNLAKAQQNLGDFGAGTNRSSTSSSSSWGMPGISSCG